MSTPAIDIVELQRACEYDPVDDSPVDSLIAYKDALEDIVSQMIEIDIVIIRDPDFANETAVFGPVKSHIVDVDLGRFDLHDLEEWDSWQAGMQSSADHCLTMEGREHVKDAVSQAAQNLDHPIPDWAI